MSLVDTAPLAEHDDGVTPRHRLLKTICAPVLLCVVAAIGLAACSGTSSSTSDARATPAVTESRITSVLPPIPISGGGDVAVKVGDSLNVITADVTSVTTDQPRVLDVSQPYSDGSATFNGGAKVIGVGKAALTVKGKDGVVLYVANVTATN